MPLTEVKSRNFVPILAAAIIIVAMLGLIVALVTGLISNPSLKARFFFKGLILLTFYFCFILGAVRRETFALVSFEDMRFGYQGALFTLYVMCALFIYNMFKYSGALYSLKSSFGIGVIILAIIISLMMLISFFAKISRQGAKGNFICLIAFPLILCSFGLTIAFGSLLFINKISIVFSDNMAHTSYIFKLNNKTYFPITGNSSANFLFTLSDPERQGPYAYISHHTVGVSFDAYQVLKKNAPVLVEIKKGLLNIPTIQAYHQPKKFLQSLLKKKNIH